MHARLRLMSEARRSATRAPILALGLLCFAPLGGAGQVGPPATVDVVYDNPTDGTPLTGYLSLPAGDGPHPGVVLLSIAGTRDVTVRLVEAGYAVLAPVRRGFVAVEPLLRATYSDLAGDVDAALTFLSSREEVDGGAIALVAQADDAPPALMATVASAAPVPLVLLAPPAFSGVAEFRREQRALARRDGARPDELGRLDRYIDRIAEIALSDAEPYAREYRLESLRMASPVQLPRNAAFPMDERQAHFFASPLWHDRLAFEPQVVLGLLRSPTLVLIGLDEANTAIDAYLDAVRRGLAAARTDDTMVCLVSGRTRHTFTPTSGAVLVEWLGARLGGVESEEIAPEACLADPPA